MSAFWVCQTANGVVEASTKASVRIKEPGIGSLDLVKGSLAVLSLGRLCKELGSS